MTCVSLPIILSSLVSVVAVSTVGSSNTREVRGVGLPVFAPPDEDANGNDGSSASASGSATTSRSDSSCPSCCFAMVSSILDGASSYGHAHKKKRSGWTEGSDNSSDGGVVIDSGKKTASEEKAAAADDAVVIVPVPEQEQRMSPEYDPRVAYPLWEGCCTCGLDGEFGAQIASRMRGGEQGGSNTGAKTKNTPKSILKQKKSGGDGDDVYCAPCEGGEQLGLQEAEGKKSEKTASFNSASGLFRRQLSNLSDSTACSTATPSNNTSSGSASPGSSRNNSPLSLGVDSQTLNRQDPDDDSPVRPTVGALAEQLQQCSLSAPGSGVSLCDLERDAEASSVLWAMRKALQQQQEAPNKPEGNRGGAEATCRGGAEPESPSSPSSKSVHWPEQPEEIADVIENAFCYECLCRQTAGETWPVRKEQRLKYLNEEWGKNGKRMKRILNSSILLAELDVHTFLSLVPSLDPSTYC